MVPNRIRAAPFLFGSVSKLKIVNTEPNRTEIHNWFKFRYWYSTRLSWTDTTTINRYLKMKLPSRQYSHTKSSVPILQINKQLKENNINTIWCFDVYYKHNILLLEERISWHFVSFRYQNIFCTRIEIVFVMFSKLFETKNNPNWKPSIFKPHNKATPFKGLEFKS